jgi:hypothetical protein
MPALLALAPIISAITGAAALGEGIYSMVAKPSAPKMQPGAATPSTLNPAQLANAVRAAKGDVQQQTGGSVAPDYLAQLVSSQYGAQAGNPGTINKEAATQWGGASAPQTFGAPAPQTPSLASLPFGNASSGGSSGSGASSTGGFNISDWLAQIQQGGANA